MAGSWPIPPSFEVDDLGRPSRIRHAIGTRQHNCEARAMATTSVCEVSVDRFEELAQKDPAVQYEIFKIMSAEIRHSQELLLLLGKHNAEKRLAAFLLSLCNNLPSAIIPLLSSI
jgi:CRP-like cAMP-binding protein